jgi:hypothetical protein
MIAELKALEPYIPVAIGLILLIILVVVVWARRDVDVTLPGGSRIHGKASPGASVEDNAAIVRGVRIDLEQYGEVAAALDALITSDSEHVEAAARQWFSQLATRLATRLTERRDHHYRVAIWLDDPNYPDRFVGVVRGLFDPGDTDMDFLDRKYTIGGLAFDSATMTYYCGDRKTDPNFKPRKHVPPSFESVFGLALGQHNNRWGVMTVDARQVNGFPPDTQWLVQRFGELASLGATIWYARVTTPGPSGQLTDTSQRL